MSEIGSSVLNKKTPDGQVQLLVGGVSYTLSKDVMAKHPESIFANYISESTSSQDGAPFVIERDGTLFQYVYDFLRYGFIPRDSNGWMTIDDKTKTALRDEAHFFSLPELIKDCDQMRALDFSKDLKTFRVVKDNIDFFKRGNLDWTIPEDVANLSNARYRNYDEEDDEPEKQQKLLRSLSYKQFTKCLRQVAAPFCVMGALDLSTVYTNSKVYKSSTLEQLNMEELLAEATLSPFGKGFETVIDTSVRHSYEIDLSKTNTFSIQYNVGISSLNKDRANQKLDIRPYKLVIYKEGGYFEAHRDTVRGDGHIGTLVLILNSKYTGGELEVTHGGRTEVVTGPYSWVAMYGDCLHKINPVASGTRVSLIYDIYSKKKSYYDQRRSPDIWELPDYFATAPFCKIPRGVDEGMHAQLAGFDSAVICLQHLYPACQANPDFLKGGDQLLYDILRDHFTLAVLPCTIYRKKYNECDDDSDDYTEKDNQLIVKPMMLNGLPNKDVALATAAGELKTNFIVVDSFTRGHVIEEEEINYTGNESQGMETVYMVAGLQVRETGVTSV